MPKLIIGLAMSFMLVACAPSFEADLASLERSFQDQRTAVERNDAAAFVRSFDRLPSLMKRTMKAMEMRG